VPATRLLLVADGPAAAKLLQRHVRPRDVCVTARPDEALALLKQGARFDAIVGDILMTGMSADAFHTAAAALAPDQAERMVFIPALEMPADGEPIEAAAVSERAAQEMARRKLLRNAAYVTPALLATFVARPAQAQARSCRPSRCRPKRHCRPHPLG
jgi:CheY-like chemotaxis protein